MQKRQNANGCGGGDWSAWRSNAPRSERARKLFWCKEIKLDQTKSNWIKPIIFKTLNDRNL
jgi:hypothetical protein